MAVNVGKTAALPTGRQRNMPNQLRLREQDVEWKSCVRYLVVHIDCSLHDTPSELCHTTDSGSQSETPARTQERRYSQGSANANHRGIRPVTGAMPVRLCRRRPDTITYLVPQYEKSPCGYQFPRHLIPRTGTKRQSRMELHAAFSLHYPSTAPSLPSTLVRSIRVGILGTKLCTSIDT
ncbi:hypothetical protein EVAR_30332_1 [Eumeta japonica]|uniref:Uncharacterized protein n=1 Tax=Eumeta variegata TaxID=151549 RepID=A0A4C1W8C7_EUMVA|nr:hypothetical protein EVAR_30332_1 [Eumeta japonica]